jgi:hypothetical protein
MGTAATTGLLYQPRMIGDGDCGEIGEVLGENLPQSHFVHYNSHMIIYPVLNPGRRDGKPATNRLSHGAAFHTTFTGVYLLRFKFCCVLSVTYNLFSLKCGITTDHTVD